MLKIHSILLYVLSFVFSFFIGIGYASWIEAGKGQMLAGGAIVLSYGVMGAFIGLILSIFVARNVKAKLIWKN